MPERCALDFSLGVQTSRSRIGCPFGATCAAPMIVVHPKTLGCRAHQCRLDGGCFVCVCVCLGDVASAFGSYGGSWPEQWLRMSGGLRSSGFVLREGRIGGNRRAPTRTFGLAREERGDGEPCDWGLSLLAGGITWPHSVPCQDDICCPIFVVHRRKLR